MTTRVYVVRMGMNAADAARLSDLLPRVPDDVRRSLLDQLWLLSVLVEQRRRTRIAERAVFDARADSILERLDPQEATA